MYTRGWKKNLKRAGTPDKNERIEQHASAFGVGLIQGKN